MPAINKNSVLNKFFAVLMMALLLLLTSMNFFAFPIDGSGKQLIASESAAGNTENFPDDNKPSPTGPDEKAPGNPVSISEEYLHDQHEADTYISDNLIHQRLLLCSKVHPAHTELITPPPDLFS
jgi:hypothetical protein